MDRQLVAGYFTVKSTDIVCRLLFASIQDQYMHINPNFIIQREGCAVFRNNLCLDVFTTIGTIPAASFRNILNSKGVAAEAVDVRRPFNVHVSWSQHIKNKANPFSFSGLSSNSKQQERNN